ncbi:OsmC family protein [Ponticaulis profundi]|uniref:OsmC family protein n=1 Tax=Ponticaulis profundi TaxID=2665222 RepID=A0ABW1SA24_9PROT
MKRHSSAIWSGTLKEGKGSITTQSGVLDGQPYSFEARFEDESGKKGTNPEELIGAAHAGCFTMQLSALLAKNETPAEKLETTADVSVESADGGGFEITSSALTLTASVPGIDKDKFMEIANTAKTGCPVSKALAGVEITLDATLA